MPPQNQASGSHLSSSPPRAAPLPKADKPTFSYALKSLSGKNLEGDDVPRILVIPVCFGKEATLEAKDKLKAELKLHATNSSDLVLYVPGNKLDESNNRRITNFSSFIGQLTTQLIFLIEQYNKMDSQQKIDSDEIEGLQRDYNKKKKSYLPVLFDYIYSDDPYDVVLSHFLTELLKENMAVFEQVLNKLDGTLITSNDHKKSVLDRIPKLQQESTAKLETDNVLQTLKKQCKNLRANEASDDVIKILDEIISLSTPQILREKLQEHCEEIGSEESKRWQATFDQAFSELEETEKSNLKPRCRVLTWAEMLKLQETAKIESKTDLVKRAEKNNELGTSYLISALLGLTHLQKRIKKNINPEVEQYNPFSTTQLVKVCLGYVFGECREFFNPIVKILKLYSDQQKFSLIIEPKQIGFIYNNGHPTPAIKNSLPVGILWICGQHNQAIHNEERHRKSSSHSSNSSGSSVKLSIYPDGRIDFDGKLNKESTDWLLQLIERTQERREVVPVTSLNEPANKETLSLTPQKIPSHPSKRSCCIL